KSFDDAKPAIRNKLFRDKRMAAQKDFVDGLKTTAKIEINEANLAKVRIDTSQATGTDDGHGRDMPPLPIPAIPAIPAMPAMPGPGGMQGAPIPGGSVPGGPIPGGSAPGGSVPGAPPPAGPDSPGSLPGAPGPTD